MKLIKANSLGRAGVIRGVRGHLREAVTGENREKLLPGAFCLYVLRSGRPSREGQTERGKVCKPSGRDQTKGVLFGTEH